MSRPIPDALLEKYLAGALSDEQRTALEARIAQSPDVIWALSPHYAINMFLADPFRGFLAMGAAVLAVTGAEALYADMGHFGRSPIRVFLVRNRSMPSVEQVSGG